MDRSSGAAVASDIPDGVYPMRVVTRMTGLSADTIRAWERRYEAVVPERTEGNARRYSAGQVRRLALLKEATERGHAIRDVAPLGEADLRRLVEAVEGPETARPSERYDHIVRAYLEAAGGFEARRAAELLSRAAALLSPTDTVFRLVVPLAQAVGEQWSCGDLSIAHERLVSGQLMGLLGTMLRMTSPQPGARRIVVAAPEGHRHELGALIGAFVAASRGMEPLYLGGDVPYDELRRAMVDTGAEVLLLSIARDLGEGELASTVERLGELAAAFEVWLGCPEGHALVGALPAVRLFHRYEDLDAALTHTS